jgi:hypothetical protein
MSTLTRGYRNALMKNKLIHFLLSCSAANSISCFTAVPLNEWIFESDPARKTLSGVINTGTEAAQFATGDSGILETNGSRISTGDTNRNSDDDTTPDSQSVIGANPAGNGVDNLREYFTSTDPLTASFVLRIRSLNLAGADAHISLPSARSLRYQLKTTNALQSASWATIFYNMIGNSFWKNLPTELAISTSSLGGSY